MSEERVRRALLFMPGDDLHKISKGAELGVDSIIMDLEDGVALNRKIDARQNVFQALLTLNFGRTERLIRINAVQSGLAADDIAETIKARPDGYVVPKVETEDDLRFVIQSVMDFEQTLGYPIGGTKILAIIESARGVINLPEIANEGSPLVALIFGAEDLAGDIGAVRTREGKEVAYARSAVVLHAAAYDLEAIDTPFVNLTDLDGLKTETLDAMRMGYTGKLAIHPNQIQPIVDIFTPAPEEIAAAQRLIAAYEAHQASGTGVFAYEGRMVDAPMIRAAQRVLGRAKASGKI
ncbi:MAG: CoA ester lyase [Anaerolineae bacterium]|jgi:citrate lyase beta subunit|nr:MAG: CoA ester lyase [Anaerolineae bacterium]